MKPYNGPQDETCPYRGGKLCAKVCPTCKFQQPFGVPGTDGIKWECALWMQHVLTIEQTFGTHTIGKEVNALRNESALVTGAVKIAQAALTGAEILAIRNGAQGVLQQLEAPNGSG